MSVEFLWKRLCRCGVGAKRRQEGPASRRTAAVDDKRFCIEIAMVEDEEGPLTDIPVDKAPAVTLCFDKPEEMSAQEGVNVFERTLPASFATEDVRHRARVLFEQGYGYKTVARVVGVSMHTVRDWGRQFKRGLFRESFSASLSRYGSDAHELVWQCHREGLSLRQIARRTGIPVSTCWSWIQKRRELEEN